MNMSTAYGKAYCDTLESVTAHEPSDESLSGFWPAVGPDYVKGNGLLVVGRATNGWSNCFTAKSLSGADGRCGVAAKARSSSEDETPYPMHWIVYWAGRKDGYNPKRSAFWRVARRVLTAVCPESAKTLEWPKHIAWSNLYKIAPKPSAKELGKSANPSLSLMELQKRGCVDLLRREVEELRPALVLVLTGWWWYWPFMEALGVDTGEVKAGELVEATAVSGGRTWVFAKHPQGKKEGVLVRRAVEAFQQRRG